jgi:hypothetical protein
LHDHDKKVQSVEVQEFFRQKRATLYKHQCGREYVRTCEETIPRHRLIVCDECLEPMPLCDPNRASYSYKALNPLPAPRAAGAAAEPKTERPVLDTIVHSRPFSQESFQWCIATERQPRRIAFASSTWV